MNNWFEANNSFTHQLFGLTFLRHKSLVLYFLKQNLSLSYHLTIVYHNVYSANNRQNCAEQRQQKICIGFCDSEVKQLSVFSSLQLSSSAIQITAHPCVCLLSVTASKKTEPSEKKNL